MMLLLVAFSYNSAVFADSKLQRPRLENYKSYGDFLAAMYAYRKQLEIEQKIGSAIITNLELVEQKSNGVSLIPAKTPTLAENYDQALLVIEGVENLEFAVEQAKTKIHPTFVYPLRYSRKTSVHTFPLAALELDAFDETEITNSIKVGLIEDKEENMQAGMAAKVGQYDTQQFSEKSQKNKKIDEVPIGQELVPIIRDNTFVGADIAIENASFEQTEIIVSHH